METKPSLADEYAMLSHEGYISEIKYLLSKLALSRIPKGNIQSFVVHLKTILHNLVDQTFMLISPPPNKNIRRKAATITTSVSHLSYSDKSIRKFRHLKQSASVPATVLDNSQLRDVILQDSFGVIKGPATFAKETRRKNDPSDTGPGPGSYDPKTDLVKTQSPQIKFYSRRKSETKTRKHLHRSNQLRNHFLPKKS